MLTLPSKLKACANFIYQSLKGAKFVEFIPLQQICIIDGDNLCCEKTGAMHQVLVGLMEGRQADDIHVYFKF